jgi:hypothetical protein
MSAYRFAMVCIGTVQVFWLFGNLAAGNRGMAVMNAIGAACCFYSAAVAR